MKILILDDERARHDQFDEWFKGHEVTHAYTPSRFKTLLRKSAYDVVCFDHDLGDRLTGYDCARWFVNNTSPPTSCLVHSWNPIGATRIADTLIAGGYRTIRYPFGAQLGDVLASWI